MFRATRLGLIASMGLLISIPCVTPAAQHHSGYVRAMEDLRLARALLQRGSMGPSAADSQDEVTLAISNIDGAMSEIMKQALPNEKKAQNVPKFDTRMTWSDRLSVSFRLLDRAKLDCSKEKDNSGNAGVQTRVLASIDEAHGRIQVAIDTVNFDYSARNIPTRND